MNPYIPFQLNEITVLKSVKNWTNTRVRVFGKVGRIIYTTPGSALELRYLHSVGEEILTNVVINVALISETFDSKFDEGSIVQILGDLQTYGQIIEDIRYPFIISAHIIRNFSQVDPELYHQASTLQSIACPKEFFVHDVKNSDEEDIHISENELEMECNEIKRKTPKAIVSPDTKGEPTKESKTTSHTNDSSIDMFEDSD